MSHQYIRPYNTKNTHPDEPNVHYDNELCMAIAMAMEEETKSHLRE